MGGWGRQRPPGRGAPGRPGRGGRAHRSREPSVSASPRPVSCGAGRKEAAHFRSSGRPRPRPRALPLSAREWSSWALTAASARPEREHYLASHVGEPLRRKICQL
nr:uncharacterized protein LOC123281250 isoform X2 [Equus asinus]